MPPAEYNKLSDNPFAEMREIMSIKELIIQPDFPFEIAFDLKTRRMYFFKEIKSQKKKLYMSRDKMIMQSNAVKNNETPIDKEISSKSKI